MFEPPTKEGCADGCVGVLITKKISDVARVLGPLFAAAMRRIADEEKAA